MCACVHFLVRNVPMIFFAVLRFFFHLVKKGRVDQERGGRKEKTGGRRGINLPVVQGSLTEGRRVHFSMFFFYSSGRRVGFLKKE